MNLWTRLICGAGLAVALCSAAVAHNQNGCIPSGNTPKKCQTVTVPEPSTLALFGIGVLGIVVARRRKK
jgi:hypothetical protein